MPTIADVAATAGVSVTSVSRVLNNEPHVRPELRDRVVRAVDALGYKRNAAARQLAANKSRKLVVFVPEQSASYFARIVLAAASECRQHGYHLLAETIAKDRANEAVERVVTRLKPDGLLFPAPLSDDAGLISAATRTGTPFVRLAGAGDSGGQAIRTDEYSASLALMRHLIAIGRRRIAFVGPPAGHHAAMARSRAYEDGLAEAGTTRDAALIDQGDFFFDSGVAAAKRLLAQSARPTAVFAANDAMALGVLAVAADIGLRVPHDLAVAGFDDSPESRMCFPALTTVRQPLARLARAGVRVLLGHEEKGESLTCQLIVRGSTSGSDRIVTDSLDA